MGTGFCFAIKFYADCVDLSAVEQAQAIKLEHFLAANRIPLCRKMLWAPPARAEIALGALRGLI
jgi:hypothetical protein